jgi:carbonic anhydrase
VRQDFELHVVHANKNSAATVFSNAVIGILFSVNNYDSSITENEKLVINAFFDSLHAYDTFSGTVTSATNDFVAFGSFMEMLDLSNRWVYDGSLTTPPCTNKVYWNVLSKVYPISQ